MKLTSLIAPVFIGSSLLLARPAVAADSPTVDSILAKYVTALGGKEAMQKVQSLVTQFKLESDTLGSCAGEVFTKAPDRQRLHIDLGANGTVDDGFDGSVAWSKNPGEGVRVKAGEELAKAIRDSQFNRELKFKSIYPDLAYKGTGKVGDEEAWVLESKPSAASKERFWLSTKTALLIRQQSEYEGPQGVVSADASLGDYKTFDGLKYPGVIKMKLSSTGQELEFTIKILNVKRNVEIDAAKFAKPTE